MDNKKEIVSEVHKIIEFVSKIKAINNNEGAHYLNEADRLQDIDFYLSKIDEEFLNKQWNWLLEQAEKAHRFEEALNEIIDIPLHGGNFVIIAEKALEGSSDS